MFPNGMPAPPQVAAAAVQAAQQAGPSILQQIEQGILNPEGDHFSVGFTLGGEVVAAIGLGLAGGASLEVVLKLPPERHRLLRRAPGRRTGHFRSGHRSHRRAQHRRQLGNSGSFGDPNQDVLQSWSGWFSNVSYGATAGLAAEGGLAVSTGGSFTAAARSS